MPSLIALVCESHQDRGADGPFITLIDGLWAYCARGYVNGQQHRWRPVEPVSAEVLRARGVHAALNAAQAHAPLRDSSAKGG
jgi:hypothetical protein